MDPFYISPENWEQHLPGAVLRVEKADGLEHTKVPSGLSVYRLLYVSLDHDEKLVPASAFVLLPYGQKYPETPLKVIVWAHGTSGIERHCSPSNHRELYYNFDAPVTMALRGYAVIAPDYAGLGSDTPFHYCSGPGHAADIAYAVTAAGVAFPSGPPFAHEWVTVGHSEGGLSAWAINEREVVKPTGGFRGSVAIAPALQVVRLSRHRMIHYPQSQAATLFYSYILSAMGRFSQIKIDLNRYFSRVGLERTRVAREACFFAGLPLFSDLTFSDVFKDPSWIHSEWAESWENRTGILGDRPLAEPILVIQGLSDMAIFPDMTQNIFDKHCNSRPKPRAQLDLYPNMGHENIMLVSQLEVFNWIEDRFNGKGLIGCSTNTMVAN
jgi:pimeloyl-ACP methyl ester carboxylesterase